MVIRETYPLNPFLDHTHFLFESVGRAGRIQKIIIFSPETDDLWNLGFGDIDSEGEIDDEVVSNNNDLVKVISTVTAAAFKFSELYPQRKMLIQPVDQKRKTLYNTIFRRKQSEFEQWFTIKGWIGEMPMEPYNPKIEYDGFEIARKTL